MGSEGKIWRTDVRSLIHLYRRALVGLVPIADEAQVSWRDGEAYDDWDAIAEVLFDQLVSRSLRWSLDPDQRKRVRFPRYGFLVPDYSEMSFIEITNAPISNGTAILHALTTSTEPFDTVAYALADGQWQSSSGQVHHIPLAKAQFRFAVRSISGQLDLMEHLDVDLG